MDRKNMILIGAAAAGAWFLLRRKSGDSAAGVAPAPFTTSGGSGASWGLPGALTGTSAAPGASAAAATTPKSPSNFVGVAPAAAKPYQGSFGGGGGYVPPPDRSSTYDEATGILQFGTGNRYDTRTHIYYYADGSTDGKPVIDQEHRRFMVIASGKPDPVFAAAQALPK